MINKKRQVFTLIFPKILIFFATAFHMCIFNISDEDAFLALTFHRLLSTNRNLVKCFTGEIASLRNVTMAHFLKVQFPNITYSPYLIQC